MAAFVSLGLVSLSVLPAQAGILFEETFDTNTTNAPAVYTNLDWSNSPNVNAVTVGVSRLHSYSGGVGYATPLTPFPGDIITVSADIGGGSVNQGLFVGSLFVLYHPGYTGPPKGALRISSLSGGGTLVPNQDVGFVPAAGSTDSSPILHHMELSITAATRTLDITFVDGSPGNTSSPYTYSYNYAVGDYTPGVSLVGWRRGTSGKMYCDNFRVEGADADGAIPEPGTLSLLALGAGLLARRRRE